MWKFLKVGEEEDLEYIAIEEIMYNVWYGHLSKAHKIQRCMERYAKSGRNSKIGLLMPNEVSKYVVVPYPTGYIPGTIMSQEKYDSLSIISHYNLSAKNLFLTPVMLCMC